MATTPKAAQRWDDGVTAAGMFCSDRGGGESWAVKFGSLFGNSIRLYSCSYELCWALFMLGRCTAIVWVKGPMKNCLFTEGRNLKRIPETICSSQNSWGKGSKWAFPLKVLTSSAKSCKTNKERTLCLRVVGQWDADIPPTQNFFQRQARSHWNTTVIPSPTPPVWWLIGLNRTRPMDAGQWNQECRGAFRGFWLDRN